MRGRRIRLIVMIAIAFIVTGGSYWVAKSKAAASLDRGKRYLRLRSFALAEKELTSYLRWFPDDAAGNLAWAEAVINSKERAPEASARLAIEKLATIPDDSPKGAEARMREGRLLFLILQKPSEAELRFLRSSELDPNLVDNWRMLWMLYDMTERFHYSEDVFFRLIELTPEEQRAEHLRQWYLSQFSPQAANADLDRLMGFLPEGALPSEETERLRLTSFFEKDPKSPMIVAAYARWLLHVNQREEASRVLNGFADRRAAEGEPFFVAASVSVSIELGQLDEAREWFLKWPGDKKGFLYWSTAGRYFDLVERDWKSAADNYSRALTVWPGPADWSLMHRQAQCLSRLGEREAAEVARAESRRIELLMEPVVHQKLRKVLVDLSDRIALQEMVSFYRSLNRDREANLWLDVIARLPKD